MYYAGASEKKAEWAKGKRQRRFGISVSVSLFSAIAAQITKAIFEAEAKMQGRFWQNEEGKQE